MRLPTGIFRPLLNGLVWRRVAFTAIGIALIIGWVAIPSAARGQTTPRAVEDRYNLVSAFLYNFLLFTEWPEDNARTPMVIGVLGENPFGRAADAIAQKQVGRRSIEFRYFSRVEDVEPTHILFVPISQDQASAELCRRLRGSPVLTVGESERFTRQGGVIRFFEQRDRAGGDVVLRVEINETAAEELGIRFRAKLMRLAQLVRYPWPEDP